MKMSFRVQHIERASVICGLLAGQKMCQSWLAATWEHSGSKEQSNGQPQTFIKPCSLNTTEYIVRKLIFLH
jgi:hypothetical protein